jgi:hypothetical protein
MLRSLYACAEGEIRTKRTRARAQAVRSRTRSCLFRLIRCSNHILRLLVFFCLGGIRRQLMNSRPSIKVSKETKVYDR